MRGRAGLTDIGMYDLKGKGATGMMRSGVAIERIQHLLGHESVTTTEIYIKAPMPEDIAMPNMRTMAEAERRPQRRQRQQGSERHWSLYF